jgi:hypothetical protein
MTLIDYAAHALGVLCVCIFAAAGVAALASLARDLVTHSERIADVWSAMVERGVDRWHAIKVLFPVAGRTPADQQAGEPH